VIPLKLQIALALKLHIPLTLELSIALPLKLFNPLSIDLFVTLPVALLFDPLLLDVLLVDSLVAMIVAGPSLFSGRRVGALILTSTLFILAALRLRRRGDEEQRRGHRKHTNLFHTSPVSEEFLHHSIHLGMGVVP
jgi:hypothetical protein